MKFDIQGILLGVVMPLLLSQGSAALIAFLDKFHTDEPEWHETIVITAYRLFSVHGAELVASTTNPYDDAAVAEIVKDLKAQATKYGYTV